MIIYDDQCTRCGAVLRGIEYRRPTPGAVYLEYTCSKECKRRWRIRLDTRTRARFRRSMPDRTTGQE